MNAYRQQPPLAPPPADLPPTGHAPRRGRRLPAGLLCLCAFAAGLSGCAGDGDFKLPGAYRIDIQQGNVIEQSMLLRLKPGMDKNQVRIILGTPILIDPFHANRWEYIYTLSRGGEIRRQRHFTLYFDDEGKLDHVEGDVVPGADDLRDLGKQTRTVDVPLTGTREKGFFRKMFDDEPPAEEGQEPPAPGGEAEAAAEAEGEETAAGDAAEEIFSETGPILEESAAEEPVSPQ